MGLQVVALLQFNLQCRGLCLIIVKVLYIFQKSLFLFPLLHHYTHFICLPLQQDSLLASPIILDLVILTELCQRVTMRPQGEEDFQSFHSVLAILSFLCKAPLVPEGTPVINAFYRQRACIENVMRCGSLSLEDIGFLYLRLPHTILIKF